VNKLNEMGHSKTKQFGGNMKILSMKIMKRVIVMFLAIIVMILFSNVPKAIAGDYLGEVCWSMHKTEDEHGPTDEGPFLMKVGVTYVGGTYYSLQGTIDVSPNPLFFNGSAVITGNDVLVTLNSSHDGSPEQWHCGGTFQIRLNIASLNGTWWVVGLCYESVDTFDQDYAAGNATLTTCP
jgi:hypothetical protein